MRRKRAVLVGLVLVVLLLFTAPVFAIGDPTSVDIYDCNVFVGVDGTSGQLYFVRYDVDYAVAPDEDAEDTWQMALYEEDGTTLVATRPLNYYEENIISMYFTAAEVALLGLTEDSEYKVKIMGNPAVFGALVEDTNMETYTLAVADWLEGEALGDYLLEQAEILEEDWVDITLLGDANLLNNTGAYYFDKAIPGLQNYVPEIFETTTSVYTYTPATFTHDYEETLADKKGERLSDALSNFGGWLGISENWMAFLVAGTLFAIFAAATYSATRQPFIGLAMGFLVVMGTAWIGLVSLTLVFVIVIAIAFFFGVTFILGRFA